MKAEGLTEKYHEKIKEPSKKTANVRTVFSGSKIHIAMSILHAEPPPLGFGAEYSHSLWEDKKVALDFLRKELERNDDEEVTSITSTTSPVISKEEMICKP